jgi:hypothetical protein
MRKFAWGNPKPGKITAVLRPFKVFLYPAIRAPIPCSTMIHRGNARSHRIHLVWVLPLINLKVTTGIGFREMRRFYVALLGRFWEWGIAGHLQFIQYHIARVLKINQFATYLPRPSASQISRK